MGLAILFLTIILLPIQYVVATANNELNFAYNCTDISNSTSQRASPTYQYNFYNLLGNFTIQATITGFYNSSVGEPPDRVYGLYMCQGDTNAQSCSACVKKVKSLIVQKCPYQMSGIIWSKNCLMRYSRHMFFGKMDVDPSANITSPRNISENKIALFSGSMRKELRNFANLTANDQSKKFKIGVVNISGFGNLYQMAQCTPDLTVEDCYQCLVIAIERVAISVIAHSLLPSCAVWYQTTPFFNSTAATSYPFFNTLSVAQPPPTNSTTAGNSSKRKRIAIVISVTITIAILLTFGAWVWMRKKKAKETSDMQMEEIKTTESLQFDLNSIRVATRNFSMDNKLGEGGFGAVYKGVLVDGQEVALKRLSKHSKQGIAEFKTEVLLLAKLQHKNLVKLLGFCLASNEKILVYEYQRNASLDRFLLDPTNNLSRDWEIRFKIILGIARGLLYLHEDSRLKIIHRDLKSSNILLDETLNPKISDFGLAKLFGGDQTQGDTKRIVGTYGYMAPEYAMTGHFSIKSDVYSFGVIVLEIVSGQTIGAFGKLCVEETLLYRAWRLWIENTILELVDTTLGDDYPRAEVTKCIHIGLLCIQDMAIHRPNMTSIIAALNGESISLPMPKTPHYFYDPTIVEMSPSQYRELMKENQLKYPSAFNEEGGSSIFTGSESITDELYPR